MNGRELCKGPLDFLYQLMADWLLYLQNIEGDLIGRDDGQEFKEQVNDLQHQGHLWVEQLDSIICHLDNSETQGEAQDIDLLCRKLHNIIGEVYCLEMTKNDQVEQDSQLTQTLEDLNTQVKHEEKKIQNLKQLTTSNNEELDKLRKEIEERENEISRLKREEKDINNKLKEQEEEITAGGNDLEELDKKISHTKDRIKKLKEKSDIIQQYLESIKKQNTEKEHILKRLKQEEVKEKDQLKSLEDQVTMQYELSDITETESNSDSEIEELKNIKSNVIRQEDHINQMEVAIKSLQDEFYEYGEPQEGMSQYKNSNEEYPTQSLQDSTISSTTQEEVLNKEIQTQLEMLSKETQTLNMLRYNKTMGYTMVFTIPFALTGISLTVIPLIRSTKNDTIFLSVGLSFSTLAIICFVAVTIYNYYTADSELPKKLSDNSIDNVITQGYGK